jgi:hypothetical protein
LPFGRWFLLCVVLLLSAAGCGSGTAAQQTKIERTFVVDWHEKSARVNLHYSASRVVFHDGRWSADVTVENETGLPLYEATWSPSPGKFTWEGPALVYSGLDVLGNRRLLVVAADTEQPDIPFPLKPGATWHGTISGDVPARPALPRGEPIWLRYPVFSVGHFASSMVHWISNKSVQL